uniref:Zinc finger protein 8 n=1 Tax=Moschus moschiferus TaxID=68415 RepID=A0A8C6CIK3_MOSMO
MNKPTLPTVSFKDVAVTFTWEEWGHLDLAQRTVYHEVALETCSHLVSLVKAVILPKPDVISQLEQGAELWVAERGLAQGCHPGESLAGSAVCSPSDTICRESVVPPHMVWPPPQDGTAKYAVSLWAWSLFIFSPRQ